MELSEDYDRLDAEFCEGPWPVISLALNDNAQTFCMPADVRPWLPSFIVPLGDPLTLRLAEIGECVTVFIARERP